MDEVLEGAFKKIEHLEKKAALLEAELSLLKSTAYVTHTVCGAIVETAQNNWGDAVDPPDAAIYVMCPSCQDIIDVGELSDGDNHYLIRKPE